MATVDFKGTLSSGGKLTTLQTNQEILFNSPNAPASSNEQIVVTDLLIDAFADQIHVTLNDEITIHEIDPNTSLDISDMIITKFTILEAGVDYRWTAMFE